MAVVCNDWTWLEVCPRSDMSARRQLAEVFFYVWQDFENVFAFQEGCRFRIAVMTRPLPKFKRQILEKKHASEVLPY
jgi:hypothetical protein